MSILPANSASTSSSDSSTSATTLCKEYAWDFEKDEFIFRDGKYVVVTGIEAVKVWIYKTLNTQKYRYIAYSQQYGNELENLMGQGYSNELIKSEVARYLKESLLISSYITGVKNVSATQEDNKLNIDFTAITIYGEVNINV